MLTTSRRDSVQESQQTEMKGNTIVGAGVKD